MREFNYPQEQLANLANTMKVLPSYALSATNTYGQVPGTASAVSQSSSDLVQMLKNLKII
jgi:hypothetical protein